MKSGLLLIFSGPSGVGKGTICRKLKEYNPGIHLSISATTRLPRKGEVNGSEYYFYDQVTFLQMIDDEMLLEWARVYDNYYGTPLKDVMDALEQGKDVILEIDMQGALQVKNKYPEAVLIFVAPPSRDELESRLLARGADSLEEIKKRLSFLPGEMNYAYYYDYLIVNDQLTSALKQAHSIITAEKMRPRRMERFITLLSGNGA